MNQESSLPTTPPDQQFQWSGGKETIESPNRWKKTGETWLIGLLLPVTLALGWEIAVAQGWSSDRLLPTVSTILNTLWDLVQSGELPNHIANTLQRVFLGFVFGTLTGTVLGSLSGYWPLVRRLCWTPLFRPCAVFPQLPGCRCSFFGLVFLKPPR